MRIASLLPSATEITLALGLADDLVGITFECEAPASVRDRVTVLVGGRDTSLLSPADIDAYVRAQVASGADLYTLHEDALAAVAPDLILTQDLCRVCALPTGRVAEALTHLGCTSDVLTLDPHSLEDVLAGIIAVADRAGVSDRGAALVGTLRDRLSRTAALVAGRARPRVAVVEWIDPVFGAGHWIPDLVDAAGGQPVACHPRQRSTPTTWEEIALAKPDIVVVAPCGYDLEGATEQASVVCRMIPGPAVWAIDADGIVVRPGPRVVAGVEALASITHPDAVEASPSVRLVRG